MRLHFDGYRSVSIGHKVSNLPKKFSLILEHLLSFKDDYFYFILLMSGAPFIKSF